MKSPLIEKLQLGQRPVVAGTVITAEFLENWRSKPQPLPCDIVELRLDGFPDYSKWLETGKQIEASGTPVFVTIRLAAEGGKWTKSDKERFPLLMDALQHLGGVDVELASELSHTVAEEAQQRGKLCVLSHHDFEKTPPQSDLEGILRRGGELGSVAKIATTANTEGDVATLRGLLRQKWATPICIIGMGPLGRQTRLTFPLEGSCLTYGFLDTPGAPGQYSARDLREHFRPGGVKPE